MSDDVDAFLSDILKRLSTKEALQREEYSRLTTLFAPIVDEHVRAKAFVALSAVAEHFRRLNAAKTDEAASHNVFHAFQATVDSKLSEVDEQPLLEVLSFVTALTAVVWQAGTTFFVRDGFQDSMMDALELFPSSKNMRLVVSGLLAASCGYKSCRASLSPRCVAWLESASRDSDIKVKATVSLALLKLSQGIVSDEGSLAQLQQGSRSSQDARQSELYSTFRDALVASDGQVYTVTEAIEGLAYISTDPSYKERITNDTDLMRKITGLGKSLQKRHSRTEEMGTAPFGLASLIANLATYRPQLSGEQAQIAKLKQMAQAKAPGGDSGPMEDFDTDDHVRARAKRLVELGAAELLTSIAQVAESGATRAVVGRALLGLIEDKSNRGRILQAGGAKALMASVRASQQKGDAQSANPLPQGGVDFTDLPSIQALAKVSITSSPLQVFGPNESASLDAIKPFACLLLHGDSTLLQRFEALMALTNLSSASPDLADRIARTDGILNKLEFLLLEENEMVRRAAAELVCNLVSGSEHAFNRCTGDGSDPQDSTKSENQAQSRLHVLVALSDVEDEPTRLAASGALAVLTGSSNACKLITLLELEHHRVVPIFKRLINPTSDDGEAPKNPLGLMHRGVVCIRNLLYNLSEDALKENLLAEAVRLGLIDALANIIKSGQTSLPAHILQPTAEALKWLVESGTSLLT